MSYVKEAILSEDRETIQSLGIEASGIDQAKMLNTVESFSSIETTAEDGMEATTGWIDMPKSEIKAIDSITDRDGNAITGQPAGQTRRGKTTNDPIEAKHKAEIIARAIAEGETAGRAMIKAGYSPSTADKGITRLSRQIQTGIQEALEEFRQRRADKVLERSARMNRQADKLMDKIESGEKLEKADIEVLRLSLREGSDLLDRVGAGKINKSMSVRKTVSEDTRTLEQLEARLAELKAKG